MLKTISSCFCLARTAPKLVAFALSSLALGVVSSVATAQEDLVIDDFSSGRVGQNIQDSADRYYSSPIPRWYYSTAHAEGASGGFIAESSSGNKYLYFNGLVNTWSMTWRDRDGGEHSILNLRPSRPFQVEFDLLNTTGAAESNALTFNYLLSDRWTNMGAAATTDPVGYRLEVSIASDTTVRYKINSKGGGQFVAIPGADGTATVEPGLFGTDGEPGRPVRISLEVYQNKQQKLMIDGVEIFDVEITDPLPQNQLWGDVGYVQMWTSVGQPRGIDNVLIRQFPEPEPEPWTPVVAGEVYWANTSMIRTAESAGSDARTVRDGFARAIGIAVDNANGKVYWTDAGNVHRSDLTGDNEETIYYGSGSAQGIAVNADAGKIYWGEYSAGFFMAGLDGSNVQQVVSLGDYSATAGAAGVSVDAATGEVYMSIVTNGTLLRMQADGSDLETVTVLPNNAYGLAIDSERNRIYYTVFANPGSLNYLDLETMEPTEIFADLGQPLGIALTADNAGLFWAERIAGKIKRAHIDEEGNIGGVETIRLGEISPFFIATTSDATGSPLPPVFRGFVNGNFEEDPYDNGWSVSSPGVAPHPGLIDGSNTAAYIPNDGGRLIQYFPQWVPLVPVAEGAPHATPVTDPDTGLHRSQYMIPIGPRWQLGFHAAVAAPELATQRSLNLLLGHLQTPVDNGAIPQINFRINGEGGADIYDLVAPAGWRNIFPAGTFEHSEVVDGVFQNPTVYYIQFDGDYSSEDPHYSVAVWKVGQSEPIAVSSTIRYWQYQPPSAGSGIVMLQFPGAGTNAPYAVDDIHLVEVGAAPEGYAVWAEGFFSAEELEDDSISGPRADADGDGLANLLEYALGGNPTEASVAELPATGVETVDGEDYLTLTFTRPTDSDLVYSVEASGELSGWAEGPVEVSSTVNGDGTTTVTYRDSEPVDSAGRRFLRLRVIGE